MSLRSTSVSVERFGQMPQSWLQASSCQDQVVIEEPLEIRLEYQDRDRWHKKSVAVTMRTPGDDNYLALGFLRTEGIITCLTQVESVIPCGPSSGAHKGPNIIRVVLKDGVTPSLKKLERNFYTTSSCGICGKASLEAVMAEGISKIPRDGFKIKGNLIHRLPEILRASQNVFDSTGAIHAAGLFSGQGDLIALFEDVGRHNAVDKVIGQLFSQKKSNFHNTLMVVSGRAGFELVQKSLTMGIPALCAVGAPSSLSISLAAAFDMTLVGFMRQERFNVYSGGWRIHD